MSTKPHPGKDVKSIDIKEDNLTTYKSLLISSQCGRYSILSFSLQNQKGFSGSYGEWLSLFQGGRIFLFGIFLASISPGPADLFSTSLKA